MWTRTGGLSLALLLALGIARAEEPATRELPEPIHLRIQVLSVPASVYERIKDDFRLERKKYLTCGEKSYQELLATMREHRDTHTLSSPQMMTMPGQSASVQIGQQHLLTSGVRAVLRNNQIVLEPETTTVETGLSFTLLPRIPGGSGAVGRSIEIDFKAVESRLGPVEEIPVRVGKLTRMIEKTQVNRNSIERTLTLPPGGTAVMPAWWQPGKQGAESQRVIVCVTAQPTP